MVKQGVRLWAGKGEAQKDDRSLERRVLVRRQGAQGAQNGATPPMGWQHQKPLLKYTHQVLLTWEPDFWETPQIYLKSLIMGLIFSR